DAKRVKHEAQTAYRSGSRLPLRAHRRYHGVQQRKRQGRARGKGYAAEAWSDHAADSIQLREPLVEVRVVPPSRSRTLRFSRIKLCTKRRVSDSNAALSAESNSGYLTVGLDVGQSSQPQPLRGGVAGQRSGARVGEHGPN